MQSIEHIRERIRSFKVQHGLSEDPDEQIVATVHLQNTHTLDLHGAQDRTSPGANDHGIDAWYFEPEGRRLTIYQSKLTDKRASAAKGFADLCQAAQWLGEVLSTGDLGSVQSNNSIRYLGTCLAEHGPSVREIDFVLISPFADGDLDGSTDYDLANSAIARLALFQLMKSRGGKLRLRACAYCIEGGSIAPPEAYRITRMEGALPSIARNTRLQLTYTSLYSLVELLRRRGNKVFEKNIRMHLNTKEAKSRLEHPLEETLAAICDGALDPNIFPFYHVGVTLTASECEDVGAEAIDLNSPYIINGCQTVRFSQFPVCF